MSQISFNTKGSMLIRRKYIDESCPGLWLSYSCQGINVLYLLLTEICDINTSLDAQEYDHMFMFYNVGSYGT